MAKEDKSTRIIVSGLLMGLGAGLFFVMTNPFAFVGCVVAGLGLGMMVASLR